MGAISLEGITKQNDNSGIRNRQVALAIPGITPETEPEVYLS
jgi:hypothetical protein